MKLAVVVANPQGLIRHWSPEAAELFGHAAGDANGKSLDVIVPPGGLRERHWAALRRATESGVMKLDRAATNDVAGYVGVFGERAGNEQPFTEVVPLP